MNINICVHVHLVVPIDLKFKKIEENHQGYIYNIGIKGEIL